MQEFSSISVSSYDAGALSDQLTAQSHDGWSVVAIVPTGSTVTAYLSRDAGGNDTAEAAAPAIDSTDADTGVAAEHDDQTEHGDEGGESTDSTDATDATDEPAQAGDDAPSPVDEPAGWAVSPEPASPTEATDAIDPMADLARAASTATDGATDGATDSASDAVTSASDATTDAAADAGSAAAGAAAPAGWYADPSARYELRYWDGTQWTEHVSRGGQQFTDPPVA